MEVIKKIGLNDASTLSNPMFIVRYLIKPMSKTADHTVYICTVDWSKYLDKKAIFWNALSTIEKQKAIQFLYAYDKNKFTIIRGILRTLLGYLLHCLPNQLEFQYTRFGKPTLVNGLIEFNLSYAKHQVIYVFCQKTSVGVDIEYQDSKKPIDKLAKRYFSKDENQMLLTLRGERKKDAFFQGWVQKEAISKALGLGFQLPLTQVRVNLNISERRFVGYQVRVLDTANQLWLYPVEVPKGFKAALAIHTHKQSVIFKQLEAVAIL